MAESIMRRDGSDKFIAYSAGSDPKGQINPWAIKTLEAYGYPTDRLHSKSWQEFSKPDAPKLDFAFTVCDSAAKEICPVWPGQPMTAHWGIEDPTAFEGNEIEKQRAFNLAFKYLKTRIHLLLAVPIKRLDRLALKTQLDEIGSAEGATLTAAIKS
jgi:arsenate reductase